MAERVACTWCERPLPPGEAGTLVLMRTHFQLTVILCSICEEFAVAILGIAQEECRFASKAVKARGGLKRLN